MADLGTVSDTLRDLVKLGKVFPAGYEDPDTRRNNGLVDVLNEIRLACGINPILEVNDCQTIGDWTESHDGTFDATADTTNEKIGTTALLLTATADCSNTSIVYHVETNFIKGSQIVPANARGETEGIDWRGYDWLGGWWFGGGANHFGGLGELKLNIENDGAWGEAVNITNPTARVALPPMVPTNAVHKRFDVDITSFARNKVTKIRFECTNPTAAEAVSLDDLIVYKYSTGRGPLLSGGATPMVPANAGVISRGDIVSYSSGIIHRIEQESAADQVDNVGVCVVPATGDINASPPKVAWITKPGSLLYLATNAATQVGEGLIWHSESSTEGHLVEGCATGEEEYVFAKGFEAAGAQYDHILCETCRQAVFVA